VGESRWCERCQVYTRHWPVTQVVVRRYPITETVDVKHPCEACELCGRVVEAQESPQTWPSVMVWQRCPGCGGPTVTCCESDGTAMQTRQKCMSPKHTGCLA
jgi:hypothetical protein